MVWNKVMVIDLQTWWVFTHILQLIVLIVQCLMTDSRVLHSIYQVLVYRCFRNCSYTNVKLSMICSHFDIKTEIDQITPIFVPFKFSMSENDCKSMIVSVYLKNIVQKDRFIQGSPKFSISYIVFLQGSGYWTFPQQGEVSSAHCEHTDANCFNYL